MSDEININSLALEAFNEALNKGKLTSEQYVKLTTRLNTVLDKSQKRFETLIGTINDQTKDDKTRLQASKKLSEEMENNVAAIRRSNATDAEKSAALAEYKESVRGAVVSNATLKDQLEAQIGVIDKTISRQEYFQESVKRVQTLFGPLANSLKQFTSGVISAYQGGSSQIGISSAVLSGAVAGAGSLLQQVGAGASAAGSGLSMVPHPAAQVAGGLLQLGGAVTRLVGGGLSEIAQKVLPVLQSELDKNITSFQAISTSGGLFVNGITGMRDAAFGAGLTITQMANVMKQNSEVLAQSGLGVAAAMNRIGDVSKAMRNSGITNNLLKLGYTFEEQAGLVAETMARMRQGGDVLSPVDQNKVAQETQKYAENLRVIAAITGEDAKKKMAEAQDAAKELAFQQKLDTLSAEQRQNTIAFMAKLSKDEQRAFMEMSVNDGQAMTVKSAALMNQIPALSKALGEAVAAQEQNALTMERGENILSQNQAAMQAQMREQGQTIGKAGMAGIGGVVGDLSGQMRDLYQVNARRTQEAFTDARRTVEGQGRTQDATTQSAVGVIQSNQDLAIAIQNKILTSRVLDTFASTVKMATDALLSLIDRFTGQSTTPTPTVPRFTRAEQEEGRRRSADANARIIQNQADIRPEDVRAQIDARQREMEANRRGITNPGSRLAERNRVLQEQIEQLTARLDNQSNIANAAPSSNASPTVSQQSIGPNQQDAPWYRRMFGNDNVRPLSDNVSPARPNDQSNLTMPTQDQITATMATTARVQQQQVSSTVQELLAASNAEQQRIIAEAQRTSPTQPSEEQQKLLMASMKALLEKTEENADHLRDIATNTKNTYHAVL